MNDYERRRWRLPSAARYASAPEKSGKHLDVNDPRNARSKEAVGGKATNEFETLNVKTEKELEGHILDIGNRDETLTYTQSDGSAVYFNKETNTYFVDNVSAPERSTAFRPSDHISGYDDGEYGLKYFSQGYNEDLDNYDRKGLDAPQIYTVGELRAMNQSHQKADDKAADKRPLTGQVNEQSRGSLDHGHNAIDGQSKPQFAPDHDGLQSRDYSNDQSLTQKSEVGADNQTHRAQAERSSRKEFVQDSPSNSSAQQEDQSQSENPSAEHAGEQVATGQKTNSSNGRHSEEGQAKVGMGQVGKLADESTQTQTVDQAPANSSVQQDPSKTEGTTSPELGEGKDPAGPEAGKDATSKSEALQAKEAMERGGNRADEPTQTQTVDQAPANSNVQPNPSKPDGTTSPEHGEGKDPAGPETSKAATGKSEALQAKEAMERGGNQADEPTQTQTVDQAPANSNVQQDPSKTDGTTPLEHGEGEEPAGPETNKAAAGKSEALQAKEAMERGGNQADEPTQTQTVDQAPANANVQQDPSKADGTTPLEHGEGQDPASPETSKAATGKSEALQAKEAMERGGNQADESTQTQTVDQAPANSSVQQDPSKTDGTTPLEHGEGEEPAGPETSKAATGKSEALQAKEAMEQDTSSQSEQTNQPEAEPPTNQPAPVSSGRDDDR